jgi:septal ring factor EnvC (AmiA/AmiB activator)
MPRWFFEAHPTQQESNRDYEGEHMRLVKHTPSAQEQSERYTRDTMDKLNTSIVDLDDDIKALINEVKELKEFIKNIRGTLKKSE